MPDPVTPLTPHERDMVAHIERTQSPTEVLRELKQNLQTAIEIELATIPIYLFTYYSLLRNKQIGQNIEPPQLFANKAGGFIMSVAVEEMLHMSLSANILFAMGVMPEMYGKSPTAYPTGLPFHNPKGPPGPGGITAVQIPLARLSFEQLWHFLQIEYPESRKAWPADRHWDTIGQFYSYIRCQISTSFVTDADFRLGDAASQIQPYNYSPNNVDTVYPREKFDPWKVAPPGHLPPGTTKNPHPSASAVATFTDQRDSHVGPTQLLTVSSKRDAIMAIDTICDQGEGYARAQGEEMPSDDPSKREWSHYYKFLKIQAEFDRYGSEEETLPDDPPPPPAIRPGVSDAELIKAQVLYDFPANPVAAHYPAELQPLADFCSGLFQYMLVMTETIFLIPPSGQKRFFNEALHRSMIWVLDKYIQSLRKIEVPSGPYKGKPMAPVFENISLGSRKDSFAALTALGDKAIAAAAAIQKNPNYSAASQGGASDASYYVSYALTYESNGYPMHLPNVAPYWP